jgi:hypothetical protein
VGAGGCAGGTSGWALVEGGAGLETVVVVLSVVLVVSGGVVLVLAVVVVLALVVVVSSETWVPASGPLGWEPVAPLVVCASAV